MAKFPENKALLTLDPGMVEMVESDIVDKSPQVKWTEIAGLEFAKKTINEIIVWPMQRPDIFTGLRAPPKGLLLFGPPGKKVSFFIKFLLSFYLSSRNWQNFNRKSHSNRIWLNLFFNFSFFYNKQMDW